MMSYLEAQFEIRKLQAMRAHAEIVSGAYKLAKKFHGTITESGDKHPFTEEELLADKVAEMKRHIRLLDQLADAIYTANKQATEAKTGISGG